MEKENSEELIKHIRKLGLEEPITLDKLKSAFRKLILKEHPDKKGDSDKFIELKKSYDYLLNWIDPDNLFVNFFRDDILLFPEKEKFYLNFNDIVTYVNIEYGESETDREKNITFIRNSICSECKGIGFHLNCEECKGTRKKSIIKEGFTISEEECKTCKDKTFIWCSKCNGIKYISILCKRSVLIPAKVSDGSKYVFKGEGNNMYQCREPGDLIVFPRFELPVPFKKDKCDIKYMMNIHPLKAYYGFKKDFYFNNHKILSLDTTGMCLIDGETLIFPGKGFRINSNKRGDLKVITNIKKKPKRKNPARIIYNVLKNRMFTKKIILDSCKTFSISEETELDDPNIYNRCALS